MKGVQESFRGVIWAQAFKVVSERLGVFKKVSPCFRVLPGSFTGVSRVSRSFNSRGFQRVSGTFDGVERSFRGISGVPGDFMAVQGRLRDDSGSIQSDPEVSGASNTISFQEVSRDFRVFQVVSQAFQ